MGGIMRRILLFLVGALGLSLRLTAATGALPSAQAVAAKWSRNASQAADDYAEGVANTDKDPTALAIAAGPRYISNVTRSFNDGSWANGLRRVGKAGWQEAVRTKGRDNFSNGVQKAEQKVAEAFAPLLAYEANVQNKVRGMANVTDGDREARMIQWVRDMRNYKKP
ncbi:MAG: hypothetical protein DMD33_00825 [Gemmatimonadetes bacterium]|nr:MAG: hypothetical protein DMD33_00825 [Gemmatimonadota bacterium]